MPRKKKTTKKSTKSTPKKKSQTLSPLRILSGIIVLILVAAGIYSYREYQNSEIETGGLIVCNEKGECQKSLHMHANLDVSICGQNKDLPKDTGRLDSVHTHKEKNLLHFEERLPADKNGNILNTEPLALKAALDGILKMKASGQCIGDYCNGGKCSNGKKANWQLTANGEKQEDFQNYVWKDGDKLELTFE